MMERTGDWQVWTICRTTVKHFRPFPSYPLPRHRRKLSFSPHGQAFLADFAQAPYKKTRGYDVFGLFCHTMKSTKLSDKRFSVHTCLQLPYAWGSHMLGGFRMLGGSHMLRGFRKLGGSRMLGGFRKLAALLFSEALACLHASYTFNNSSA
jgi:hypothetical protein